MSDSDPIRAGAQARYGVPYNGKNISFGKAGDFGMRRFTGDDKHPNLVYRGGAQKGSGVYTGHNMQGTGKTGLLNPREERA